MSVKRRRRGFWGQSREALMIWGAAAVILLACIVLGIYMMTLKLTVRKAHNVEQLTVAQIQKTNTTKADKLMIVAHPDDETIWGGGHLMEGGWLVVCLTNGRNETRREEFLKAVDASGNTPMILEYPDKVNGERDSWDEVMAGIKQDVRLILGYKKWTQIATHNPNGEYGHQHHIMTSHIVSDACAELDLLDRLSFFGRYYTKEELGQVASTLTPMTSEQRDFKDYLLSFYRSQKSTVDKLSHMDPYEIWIPAVLICGDNTK
ncbi:MAG: PIG-L family deacetylase [Ruminococcus sp.]|nr:PIG-L family deacetylase [Ruminococcus sp.]